MAGGSEVGTAKDDETSSAGHTYGARNDSDVARLYRE